MHARDNNSASDDMEGSVMGIWIIIILLGISASFSFYMAFLAFQIKEGGVWLFACFGLLFGILFLLSLIKALPAKGRLLKRADEIISGKPEPVRFVPHNFMIWAIIIVGVCILAVIVIPIFFK